MIANSRHRAAYRYHPRFGVWHRPDIHVRVLGPGGAYIVRTNGVGARCDREPSPSAARRVLVIGCSFAAGDGVSNAARFSDVLERLAPGIHTHNYAISGTGHDQQYLVHQTFGEQIRPDVLIVAPVVGCIVRNLARAKVSYDPLVSRLVARPKPYFTLDGDELALQNVPVPRANLTSPDAPSATPGRLRDALPAPLLGAWRAANAHLQRRAGHYLEAEHDPAGLAYRLARAIVCRLLDDSPAAVKLLVPLPSAEYFASDDPPNYLGLYRDIAARTGARCVDLLPRFRTTPLAERGRFTIPSDSHYSADGHHVVALELARALGAA